MADRATSDLLTAWAISAAELSEIVAENPSMRGLMFGFVAEYKLRQQWLLRPGISDLSRPRSHSRREKGDFQFRYRDETVRLEVKSLDTPKVKGDAVAGYTGTFQCNASDTRSVQLPDGSTVVTNCLVAGEFDVLAVCLHAFGGGWRFGFALNRELPRSNWRGYSPVQQAYLLKSAMKITWPLEPPFSGDLVSVLDDLVRIREASRGGGRP